MQNLTQPTLLLKPFAESGTKNSIPNVNTDPSNPQKADLTYGFPSITSESPDNGGLPPERADFNGLGYLTTSYDYFYQAGGTFTYNTTIASAIGGYPAGARLWYTDSNGISCILRSSINDNTNNFLTDPTVIGSVGSGKPWEIENFIGVGLNTAYVTNCITYIPQDINLELNAGALTLKAGSKLYQPNGAGVFTPITISSDEQRNNFSNFGSGVYLVFRSTNQYSGHIIAVRINSCVSGATDTSTESTHAWYDTINNIVKIYENGTYTYTDLSLPIAVVTNVYGTGITSIDQVFNGFGYIGSTIFVLPGVVGLIPDGRNEDGSLKNKKIIINNLLTHNVADTELRTIRIIYRNNSPFLSSYNQYLVVNSDNEIPSSGTFVVYNISKNTILVYVNGVSGNELEMWGGIFKIGSYFNPKTVFHAVDYNNLTVYLSNSTVKSKIAKLPIPDYSAGVSKTDGATAPADGWAVSYGRNANVDMKVNNVKVAQGNWIQNEWSGNWNMQIMVSSGDKVTGSSWTFFPFKY